MHAARYEIPIWESLELLRTANVGRLCVIEHGYPIAVPINFRIVGTEADSHIVVRTAPDSLIGRYQGPASLEVDEIQLDKGTAWSVIVRGTLSKALESSHLPDPKPLLTVGRHQWVILQTSAISGRRFVVAPADDGYSVEWALAAP
jgi:Pyridoxamine 5'-phosphate oxidase